MINLEQPTESQAQIMVTLAKHENDVPGITLEPNPAPSGELIKAVRQFIPRLTAEAIVGPVAPVTSMPKGSLRFNEDSHNIEIIDENGEWVLLRDTLKKLSSEVLNAETDSDHVSNLIKPKPTQPMFTISAPMQKCQ